MIILIFYSLNTNTTKTKNLLFKAITCFRCLVAGLLKPRPIFHPKTVNVEFLVDEPALRRVSLKFTQNSPCQYHSA